ncbi:HEAT repeat domain-containing protein [Cecembia rubra]|uniref:HEAT repeat protein n=1 Tax=Cecembia rubra TaxID=1485585 RepID=A0A2P8EDH4_9BACT|nr:HEAT repeat domain-containing protein [Cecembia rubra]PSL07520.1 hypothetical protein CLV48_101452 [Cecembia rubra]
MSTEIQGLIHKMCNKDEAEAYVFADQLAKIGTEEVLKELLIILKSGDMDNAFLAARALSQLNENQLALDELLEVIHDKKNQHQNGGLVQMLGGFDLSDKFVDIFRIFLFGNFKASLFAKEYLDTVEFEISPRVLKKVEKHWNHYLNNSNPNDDHEKIKRSEAEEIIKEIKELLKD